MNRFIIIVLDSLGVGELPDAAEYNSVGANTLGHIAAGQQLSIPHLRQLGLANIIPLDKVEPVEAPLAAYGKMAASSAGMDTTSGHWKSAAFCCPNGCQLIRTAFRNQLSALWNRPLAGVF